MNRKETFVLLMILSLSATLSPSSAQTGSASLVGSITDPSGAVVAGANVTTLNVATNASKSTTTNDAGYYEFSFLAPGQYSVVVDYTGFPKKIVSEIELELRKVSRVDVALETGVVTEEVRVDATSQPLLQTDSPEISRVFKTDEVAKLPLLTRNFASLLILTPGTVPGVGSGSNYGVGLSPGFIIGGGGYNSTEFTIEGSDNNNQYHFHNSMSPSIEAINEVKVITGAMSAEYGRGSSSVDLALKSGGNDFHGSVYNYHQRTVPVFYRNQYGANVGGPLHLPRFGEGAPSVYSGKNKLFFYFSWEALRSDNTFAVLVPVPTADQRAGRFSINIRDPLTGQLFPNRTIPADRITEYGKRLISLFPLPNEGNLFRGNGFINEAWDQYDGKVDYILSEKSTLAFSFARREYNRTGYGASALAPSVIHFNFRRGAITYTRTISSKFTNTFQISSHRDSDLFSNQETLNGLDFWKEIGANLPGHGPGYPYTIIGGADFNSLTGENPGPRGEDDTTYQIRDTLRWVKGNHSFTAGIDFRWVRANALAAENVAKGLILHLGQYTGSGLADLLLGKPFLFVFNPGLGQLNFRTLQSSYFFQDDWRITKNLTLNLGLRYDYFTWPIETQNRLISASPELGKIVIPSSNGSLSGNSRVVQSVVNSYPPGSFITNQDVGLPRSLRHPDRNNWAPRLGFAYRPSFIKDSTIRGSYGISYTPEFTFLFETSGVAAPFSPGASLLLPNARTFDISDPFANFSRASLTALSSGYYDPNYQNEATQTWSLNVQKALPGRMVIDVGYVGSRKAHGGQTYNVPTPKITLFQRESTGDARFDSLQAQIRKDLSHGLLYSINYTWSKSMDDQSTEVFGTRPNYASKQLNWGPTAFSRKHVMTSNFIYELPFGRKKHWLKDVHPVIDGILGGWNMTGIVTLLSGPLLTITSINNLGVVPADRIGSGKLDNPTPAKWFDTSAFKTPPPGRRGNSGRGVVEGPGSATLDLGILKSFRITESTRFEFRVEMYNALERVNLGQPDVNQVSPNFGRILTPGVANRRFQLAGRFEF